MTASIATAAEVIGALVMRAHPEGGWYVETWRAPEPPGGGRPSGSAILYLLARGERSHWHAVDAAEVWQWSAGEPLELSVWAEGGSIAVHRLGGHVTDGEVRRSSSLRVPGRRPDRSARGRSSAASSRQPSSSAGSALRPRAGSRRRESRRVARRPALTLLSQPPSRSPHGDP